MSDSITYDCVRAVPCQPTWLHQPCRTGRYGTAPHNSKNGCLTSTRVSQAPPTNYSAPRVIKLLDASFWFLAPTALPLVTENIRHYLERSKAETLKLIAIWGEERIQKKLQRVPVGLGGTFDILKPIECTHWLLGLSTHLTS